MEKEYKAIMNATRSGQYVNWQKSRASMPLHCHMRATGALVLSSNQRLSLAPFNCEMLSVGYIITVFAMMEYEVPPFSF